MLTKKVGSYFGINEDTRQWVVGKGIFAPLEKGTVYQYEDIVDFELLEDGTSVVKGAWAGPLSVVYVWRRGRCRGRHHRW